MLDPDERPVGKGALCGLSLGSNLQAATRVAANDKQGRERLCRCILRPPLANDRLSILDHGNVHLASKRPWSDGTSSGAFLARLLSQPGRSLRSRAYATGGWKGETQALFQVHQVVRSVTPGVRHRDRLPPMSDSTAPDLPHQERGHRQEDPGRDAFAGGWGPSFTPRARRRGATAFQRADQAAKPAPSGRPGAHRGMPAQGGRGSPAGISPFDSAMRRTSSRRPAASSRQTRLTRVCPPRPLGQIRHLHVGHQVLPLANLDDLPLSRDPVRAAWRLPNGGGLAGVVAGPGPASRPMSSPRPAPGGVETVRTARRPQLVPTQPPENGRQVQGRVCERGDLGLLHRRQGHRQPELAPKVLEALLLQYREDAALGDFRGHGSTMLSDSLRARNELPRAQGATAEKS